MWAGPHSPWEQPVPETPRAKDVPLGHLLGERSLNSPEPPKLCLCQALSHCSSPPDQQGGQRDAGGGGKASRKPLWGRRQSRSHHRWQQSSKQKVQSFHQAKFGARVPPSAERGQGESHGAGAAPRPALAGEGRARSPAGHGGSQPLPGRPSRGSGAAQCGGPALPVRLGGVGQTPREGQAGGGEGLSRSCSPGSGPVVPHTEWTLHYSPSQRAAQLLDGALGSLQSQLGLLAFSEEIKVSERLVPVPPSPPGLFHHCPGPDQCSRRQNCCSLALAQALLSLQPRATSTAQVSRGAHLPWSRPMAKPWL